MLKSRSEMAHFLGISPRTLRRRLKKKNIHLDSGFLDLSQQEIVLKSFGFIPASHNESKNLRNNEEKKG